MSPKISVNRIDTSSNLSLTNYPTFADEKINGQKKTTRDQTRSWEYAKLIRQKKDQQDQ